MVLLDNYTYEMYLGYFPCPETKVPRHFFFAEVWLLRDFKWSTSKNTCTFCSKMKTRMSGTDPLLSIWAPQTSFTSSPYCTLQLSDYLSTACSDPSTSGPLEARWQITAVSPPFRNIRINTASYLQFPARLLHRIQETIFSLFAFQEIVLCWYYVTGIHRSCHTTQI